MLRLIIPNVTRNVIIIIYCVSKNHCDVARINVSAVRTTWQITKTRKLHFKCCVIGLLQFNKSLIFFNINDLHHITSHHTEETDAGLQLTFILLYHPLLRQQAATQ